MMKKQLTALFTTMALLAQPVVFPTMASAADEDTNISIATATTTLDTTEVLYGDVNLDGNITLSDVVLLSKYISGGVTLNDAAKANANANGNGTADSGDVLTLMKFQLRLIDTLPDTDSTETVFYYTAVIDNLDVYYDEIVFEDASEAVVTSSDELSAYLLQFLDETDAVYTTYLAAYDDEFFAENVLLLNLCIRSSSNVDYGVDEVTSTDGQITVDYHYVYSDEPGCDVVTSALVQIIIPSNAYTGETIIWNNTTTETSEFTYDVTVDNIADIMGEDPYYTVYDMMNQGVFPNLYTDTEEGNATYITSIEELEAFFTVYEDDVSLTYAHLIDTYVLPYYQEIYDDDFFATHDLVLRGVSRMDSWNITDVSWNAPTLTISSEFYYMDCVEVPYLYQIVLPKLSQEEITIDWNTTGESTEQLPNYLTWVDVGFDITAKEAVVTSVEELEAYLNTDLENYADLSERYNEDFFVENALLLKSVTMVYGDDMVYTIDDVTVTYSLFGNVVNISYHYTTSTFDGSGDCMTALMQVAVPTYYAERDIVWECTTPDPESLSFTYLADDLTDALGEELAADFMNTIFFPAISDDTAVENATIFTSRAALEESLGSSIEYVDCSEYDDAFFAENTLVICQFTMQKYFAVSDVRSNGSLLQIDTVAAEVDDEPYAPYWVQVVIPQTDLENVTLNWTVTDIPESLVNFMTEDSTVFTYTAPEIFDDDPWMAKTLQIETHSVLLYDDAEISWIYDDTVLYYDIVYTDDGYVPFSEEGEWSEDENGNPVYGNGTSYSLTWTDSAVIISSRLSFR